MNSPLPDEGLHPIQVVVRRSGVSADLLRAWERRYQAVTPVRSETGRRLYSDADIERLRLIREAMSGGRRVGDVAGLPAAEIERLITEDRERQGARAAALVPASSAVFMTAALAAMRRADQGELRAVLSRALLVLTPARFVNELATPFMHHLGDLWQRGEIGVGHEHAASEVMRRLMSELMSMLQPSPGAPMLVMATLSGQRHEIGALFAASAAALDGWRVTYLGTDLPATEIGRTALDADAIAIGLSVTTALKTLFTEIADLRATVGDRMPILVGGQAAKLLADERYGVTVMRDTNQFLETLRALVAEGVE